MRQVRSLLGRNRSLEVVLIGGQAAGILATIVMARSVGPAGRGTVVTLSIWGQLLGWIAAFSVDQALVVLTSGEHPVATPDEGLRALQLPVLATSLLAAVVAVPLGRRLFQTNTLVVGLAATAAATAHAELFAGWLLATGKQVTFICWRASQPFLYVTITILAAVSLGGASVALRTTVMAFGVVASMTIPVLGALLWMRRTRRSRRRGLGELLRFAAVAQIGGFLQYLNGRLDLLALTLLVAPQSLGHYSAGSAFGQLALITASAGVIRGITGRATGTDRVGLALAACIGIAVIASAPLVIPAVFGRSFEPAVPVARILALGAVANFALQAACGRLLRRRQPWLVSLSQGVGVIGFAIGLALFPTIVGAAWASAASFAIALLVAQISLVAVPAQVASR